MMRTEATTTPSATTKIQERITKVEQELRERRENEEDYIDTFEFGFIAAMKAINEVYNLGIAFEEE